MFVFVFIYGCQLRDVTVQSEALFGAQSKFINNNALQLFSRENYKIFLPAVACDLFKKFFSFLLVDEGNPVVRLMSDSQTICIFHSLKIRRGGGK